MCSSLPSKSLKFHPRPKLYFKLSHSKPIKGESRIEYVPYQREVTEYVTQEVVEYVPREKKVTDYYAVQYDVEYVPQVY